MQDDSHGGGGDGSDAGTAWLAAMRRGDLPAAWRVSDASLAARDPRTRDDPGLPYHERWVWDGRPFAGRRVLVRCYHGLGDTIQFARYLPALGRAARHLTVEAQPELLPLLRHLPGVDRWVPFDPAHPAPPAETDLEIMELAHALRQPPAPDAYLPAPDPTPYRAELAGGPGHGPLVGVCWQAGGWDLARSIPLQLLRPVLDGWRPVLLQRGPAADEALGPEAPPFANPHDRSLDIMRSAGLLAACDAVVTVDTMVAHLAGALGRPTALLLRADADWRWPGQGQRTPWYGSVRLFPQQLDGHWPAPLRQVRQWLTRASLSHPGVCG